MVEKLFWQNPYLTELETEVVTVDKDTITLKKTILFAFSGGQESDQGTINGYDVLEAKKVGLEIFYKLQADHDLKPNDKVKVIINWERRYKLMRLHFAAEVVLELIYKQFANICKIGAHIAQNKARIDFAFEKSMAPFIAALQSQAQSIIDTNQTIISAFSDEKNERRYWKIDNFSQVSYGGTHVKSTSEIGTIKLKRVNLGQGKERIEIYVS